MNPNNLLYFTAVIVGIIFLPLAAAEVAHSAEVQDAEASVSWSVVLAYIACGAALNYSIFLCTTVNSPLATGVAGNMKAVLSTGFGVMVYGSSLTALGWTGLIMSTVGGALYSLEPFLHVRDSGKRS
mmetsp:Transcript_97309/g.259839  ORF Transcript_97309/g.259839 Transcript_97309/m.259839 type:complete len:127 (-) Transcript_97309:321-701(-)